MSSCSIHTWVLSPGLGVGDTVAVGQYIGDVGHTGVVADHLHFVIFVDNLSTGPVAFMTNNGVTLGQ